MDGRVESEWMEEIEARGGRVAAVVWAKTPLLCVSLLPLYSHLNIEYSGIVGRAASTKDKLSYPHSKKWASHQCCCYSDCCTLSLLFDSPHSPTTPHHITSWTSDEQRRKKPFFFLTERERSERTDEMGKWRSWGLRNERQNSQNKVKTLETHFWGCFRMMLDVVCYETGTAPIRRDRKRRERRTQPSSGVKAMEARMGRAGGMVKCVFSRNKKNKYTLTPSHPHDMPCHAIVPTNVIFHLKLKLKLLRGKKIIFPSFIMCAFFFLRPRSTLDSYPTEFHPTLMKTSEICSVRDEKKNMWTNETHQTFECLPELNRSELEMSKTHFFLVHFYIEFI